jgi:hypothetical protein
MGERNDILEGVGRAGAMGGPAEAFVELRAALARLAGHAGVTVGDPRLLCGDAREGFGIDGRMGLGGCLEAVLAMV